MFVPLGWLHSRRRVMSFMNNRLASFRRLCKPAWYHTALMTLNRPWCFGDRQTSQITQLTHLFLSGLDVTSVMTGIDFLRYLLFSFVTCQLFPWNGRPGHFWNFTKISGIFGISEKYRAFLEFHKDTRAFLDYSFESIDSFCTFFTFSSIPSWIRLIHW